jgi:hypothetical protein
MPRGLEVVIRLAVRSVAWREDVMTGVAALRFMPTKRLELVKGMLVGLNLPCGEGKHDDDIKMLATFRVWGSGVSLSRGWDVECGWK